MPLRPGLLSPATSFQKDAGRPAREAARKLRKAIPEPLRPEADRLAAGLDVAAEPPGPWEPRLLFQRDGQWYLAAWNAAKHAEHLFRLDRIATVEVGTRVFGEHKGPPVARYAKRNLYFESGAERDVTLRFRGAAARLARERYGARAQANADRTVSVTMRVTPGNYLFGIVLGYGSDATPDGPADVVAAFRSRVEELAQLYA